MRAVGCGGTHRRTQQLYSNHIKHPTNPAGRLGIINLQPSCAGRTRLNPALSRLARSLSPTGLLGGAGPADEREMLGLRLATPEINHVSSCGRFHRLGAQGGYWRRPIVGPGQSSVVRPRGRRRPRRPWPHRGGGVSDRPHDWLAEPAEREGGVGRQRGRRALSCVSNLRPQAQSVFLQTTA